MPADDPRVEDALVLAATETLRPLVKRLLAANVPLGRLEAALRELFVEVAEHDFPLADRPQTDSRIALLTGINRKEVRRIRAKDDGVPAPQVFGRNRAASLIGRWVSDAQATDRAGRPRPIPYRARRGPSFARYAQEVAPDLPPRPILDELLRSGAVRLDDSGLVELITHSYVPTLGRPEKLGMLAEDPAELIETMLSNVFGSGTDALLQRKVFFDNLGQDGAERVRARMRSEGERFLRRIERILARSDRDRNPRAAGGERYCAGVGVYFFERRRAVAPAPEPQRSSPRKSKRSRSKEVRR